MNQTTTVIRTSVELHQIFKERAEALQKERGLTKLSLGDYMAEASQFFEDNRPKKEDQ